MRRFAARGLRRGGTRTIGYVAWGYEKAATLEGVHRAARDQWLRASQSIPLNIAEGNGKTADADRIRHFEMARGSALECAGREQATKRELFKDLAPCEPQIAE